MFKQCCFQVSMSEQCYLQGLPSCSCLCRISADLHRIFDCFHWGSIFLAFWRDSFLNCLPTAPYPLYFQLFDYYHIFSVNIHHFQFHSKISHFGQNIIAVFQGNTYYWPQGRFAIKLEVHFCWFSWSFWYNQGTFFEKFSWVLLDF